jgi:hypothetical protein
MWCIWISGASKTNSVELGPSREAISCAATQELPTILWNPKVNYRFRMNPPSTCLYPGLDQSSPHHPILSTQIRLGLPSRHFPSGFPTNNLYAFLLSPVSSTCPAHFILLGLIFKLYLGKSTSYEALSYADFSNLLSLHPSSVQIFS